MFNLSETPRLVEARSRIAEKLASYPDFPKPGILFRDISPIFEDPAALQDLALVLRDLLKDEKISKVVSAEARGFLLGVPTALEIGAGFVMVRKPGKLPGKTIEASYSLEYGTNRLQMNAGAVKPGERVLIVDDLLATGGTAAAMAELVKREGGEIAGMVFLIELEGLPGRKLLKDKYGVDSWSLITVSAH
ncbi:MAG: adenine phosphoribosyltransferase [Mesosutterella sp.]|nr:adenine phosphoribosyltransferase [Mesosutterella sp.]